MKIVICAQQADPKGFIDNRFGRSAYFAVYDDVKKCWGFIENTQNLQATQGAGIQAAQHVLNAEAEVLLACHLGPKAAAVLKADGVSVFQIQAGVRLTEALSAYQAGQLESINQANVEGHWV